LHHADDIPALDQVRRLIERLAPNAICDDCITERLGLSARQHANDKTRELAGSNGFERRLEPCSICDVRNDHASGLALGTRPNPIETDWSAGRGVPDQARHRRRDRDRCPCGKPSTNAEDKPPPTRAGAAGGAEPPRPRRSAEDRAMPATA
jgi:hypothetical protein